MPVAYSCVPHSLAALRASLDDGSLAAIARAAEAIADDPAVDFEAAFAFVSKLDSPRMWEYQPAAQMYPVDWLVWLLLEKRPADMREHDAARRMSDMLEERWRRLEEDARRDIDFHGVVSGGVLGGFVRATRVETA